MMEGGREMAFQYDFKRGFKVAAQDLNDTIKKSKYYNLLCGGNEVYFKGDSSGLFLMINGEQVECPCIIVGGEAQVCFKDGKYNSKHRTGYYTCNCETTANTWSELREAIYREHGRCVLEYVAIDTMAEVLSGKGLMIAGRANDLCAYNTSIRDGSYIKKTDYYGDEVVSIEDNLHIIRERGHLIDRRGIRTRVFDFSIEVNIDDEYFWDIVEMQARDFMTRLNEFVASDEALSKVWERYELGCYKGKEWFILKKVCDMDEVCYDLDFVGMDSAGDKVELDKVERFILNYAEKMYKNAFESVVEIEEAQ